MAEDTGAPGSPGQTTHAPTTPVADGPGPSRVPPEVVAFWALFDRWFDSCVDVAWQVLHDADAAAEVAQDTFFAAWHARSAKVPSAEAGAGVLRAARDGALGRLAQARHRSPGSEPWPSSGAPAVPSGRDRDAGADLVRATFAALGEADASVLDLHLRHGFTIAELGQALGVPRHDAQELVLRLNRRLGRALRAWALWPASRPGGPGGCDELRAALEANGVRTFGPEAVAETARHTKACVRCQDRQRLADTAEALYAAVPVVPAGTLLAEATASALAARGVPPRSGAPAAAPAGPADSLPPAPASAPVPAPLPARPSPPDTSPPPGPPVPPGAVTAATGLAGPASTPPATAASGAPVRPPDAGAWATPGPAAEGRPPGSAEAGTGASPAGDAGGRGAHFSGPASPAGAARRNKKGLAVAVAVVAALALSAGAAFALAGDDGDPGASTTTRPPATGGPEPTAAPSTPTTASPATATIPTTAAAPTTATTAGPGGPPATMAPAGPATTTSGAPPEVLDFSVASVTLGRPCAADQRRITLSWQVLRADNVQLSGVGAPAGLFPATGQGTACRVSGPPVTYTLTATGPGGTQTATLQA